jgi:hypothetical protein
MNGATPDSSPSRLYLVSFATGLAIMAGEISVGRLVAPFLGTSTMVWALLIGAVLCGLTIGQLIGGSLCRRGKTSAMVYALLLVLGGLFLALLPAVTRPLLGESLSKFRSDAMTSLLFSGGTTSLLLACPMIVLGAIGPLLISRAEITTDNTGATSGRIYAFGSIGSLLGTYLSGLVLIPSIGTSATFLSLLPRSNSCRVLVRDLDRYTPKRALTVAASTTIHRQETRKPGKGVRRKTYRGG